VPYKLKFSTAAESQLKALAEGGAANAIKLKKVRRALALLEQDPRYPGLHSHQYENVPGESKARVWDSYVENKTPSAWRIFWMYGPNEIVGGQEVAIISVLAITPHP
jgi:hypothetical protein